MATYSTKKLARVQIQTKPRKMLKPPKPDPKRKPT